MRSLKFLPLLFLSLVLVPCGVYGAETVSGDAHIKATLYCVPKKAVMDKHRVISLTPGEGLAMSCFVINTTKEALSGMLLGKQSMGDTTAAVSTGVNLAGEEKKEFSLTFPPVFVSGSYTYLLSVMGNNGQPLSGNTLLTGVLAGKKNQLRLKEVTLEKTQYQWGEQAKLTVALTASGEEASLLKQEQPVLSVDMLTAAGASCAPLLNKEAVTKVTADYSVTLSQDKSCVNGLKVMLVGKDGKILDQKTIVVPLPSRTEAALSKSSFAQYLPSLARPMMLLAWLCAIVLAFLGYFLWKHRRS